MKKVMTKIRHFFLPLAFVFIAASFSSAYFSDSVSTTNNSLTAATWSVTPTATATATITATATPEVIVINEIYSNPLSGEIEWIELKNKTNVSVTLSYYTIEDGTGVQKNLNGHSINASGYIVLEKGSDFTFGLNNGGDTVILRKSASIMDKVSYGNWNDGDIENNAPAPGLGKSIARIIDGNDSGIDNSDFQIRANLLTTHGGQNV